MTGEVAAAERTWNSAGGGGSDPILGAGQRGRFYAFAPYNWIVGVLTIGYAVWRRLRSTV